MSGIEVIGRDSFGVFPLKGKFLNVREANHNVIINNKELQDLIKILGLQMGRDYTESLKGLRYGNLMIMADQDYDGSHIKGLIINFIHHFWPSLIKRNDFLKEFITPIVKVSKNDNSKSICFYTIKEYRDWYEVNKSTVNWKIKYYKGLGTSTSVEAKEYFKNIVKNRIAFKYKDLSDEEAIELAFSKLKCEARKEWLAKFDQNSTFIDHSKCEIRYKEFIDKELILFSNADNIRSIPSIMDGLKPSERKILFACFKRNLKSELKVAQLAGYVAEHSLYHHGEQSLCSTITSMAQDFVGSNNINLLLPIGQFGNRYSCSKSAASPRYIYTSLNKITRTLFKEEDDNLFTYIVEEGTKIEPLYYAPVIPMILCNGAQGIGTGWSTSIPQYNPIDLAVCIMNKINGNDYPVIKRWYRGFRGEISDNGKNAYTAIGVIHIIEEENCVEISELPLQRWTIRDYKSFLEEAHIENKETANKEKDFEIEDIKEYHTENNVFFRVKLTEDSYKKISNLTKEELLNMFKLTTQISSTNMVLFDTENRIKRYSSVVEIIDEYFEKRLDYYIKRREYMLNKLQYQLEMNKNKMQFIKMMLGGTVSFLNMTKLEVCNSLKEKGFLSNGELKRKYKSAFKIYSTDLIIEEVNEDENLQVSVSDFDYLMNMNIWSLTRDKVSELEGLIKGLNEQVIFLEKNDEKMLWKLDLEKSMEEFKLILKIFENESDKNVILQNKKINLFIKQKMSSKTNNKKKKEKKTDVINLNESEEEFDSDLFDNESQSDFEENQIPNLKKSIKKTEKSIEKREDISNSNKKSTLLKRKLKKIEKIQEINDLENGSSESEVIKQSVSSRTRNIHLIKEKSSPIKENNKSNSRNKNKMIIDDDEEEHDEINEKKKERKDLKKNYNWKKKSGTKVISSKKEEIQNNIINQELSNKPETNSFLKMLEVKSKDLEKKMENDSDKMKLSLKERLALKVSQGKIDDYFNAMQNFSLSNILKTNPYSHEVSNEEVIKDLISKKNEKN